MWRQISKCTHSEFDFEQISHVGLRTDGEFALIFSSGEPGVVWDIVQSRIRRFLPDDLPVLDKVISREGFLNINYGLGNGKYRIFGDEHSCPLAEHLGLGLGMAVDVPLEAVTLFSIMTGEPAIVLPYQGSTCDWVVGSFSDDGSIAAVAEQFAVTFYANTADAT